MRFSLVLLGFVVIILIQLFDGILSDSEDGDGLAVSSTKASPSGKKKNRSQAAPRNNSSTSRRPKSRRGRPLGPNNSSSAKIGKNGVKRKTPKKIQQQNPTTTELPDLIQNQTALEPTQNLITSTEGNSLPPWGPTDRGNYTTEGIYIEVMEMPMTCNRTSQTGDYLTTEYVGTFPDGKKFDSTYDRLEPMKYKLGRGEVIQGCEIGTTRMCVGEKRRLIIPPNYAYGDKKHGEIPPASTLHFEITLTGLLEDPFAIFDKMGFGHI